MTRTRSGANADQHRPSQEVLANAKLHQNLVKERDEGLLRGARVLADLTVDWEALGWSAVKTGVSTALSLTKPKWGKLSDAQPELKDKSSEYAQNAVLLPAASEAVSALGEKVGGFVDFLQKIVRKVKERIGKSKWFQRAKNVIGIGFDVLGRVVANMIKSLPLKLDLVIPFWAQAKGVVKGIDAIIMAAETKADLNQLESAADAIGEGVPTVAFEGFVRYVRREMLMWAGKAVYQFGKSLAGVLVQVFAAPAMSIMNMVTAIVEAVYSFVKSLYQAFCFHNACKKCRQYLKNGGSIQEFGDTFTSIVAACPLIGAVLFSQSHYIGPLNLSCMLSDFSRVIADGTLICSMVSKVTQAQMLACKYINQLSFKPSARGKVGADALAVIKGTATRLKQEQAVSMSKGRKVWNWFKKIFN